MEHKDYKKSGKTHLVAAVLALVLALFFFAVSADMEDSYKYYFDEDQRNAAKIYNIIGWGALVFAVVDVIQGVAYLSVENGGNLIACADCGKMVSKNASQCPSCGRELKGQPAGASPAKLESEKIPAWKQVQLDKEAGQQQPATSGTGEVKCIFCDRPLSDGQRFCGHCGRRQD